MDRFFKKATFFLAALSLLFAGSTIHYARMANSYGQQLTYGSQRAMSQLVSELSQMDAALCKLRYASTPHSFQTISAQLMQSAENAKSAMSALSLEAGALDSTQKFVGQTGDFAYYLLSSSAEGLPVSEEHRAALDSLYVGSEEVTREIGTIKEQLDLGQLAYSNLLTGGDHSSGGLSEGMQGVEQNFPKYATLIYDGPFSEHLSYQTPLLTEDLPKVSPEDAIAHAAAFSGLAITDLSLLYETENAVLPAWCLAAEDGTTLEVSKQGGLVFSYRQPRAVGYAMLTAEEAIANARAWLADHGYTNMKESYYALFDNTITINFAYTENDITVYGDLIKVTVALDNGTVIGMEARGYLMSHHSRTLPRPVISAEKGRAILSDRLEILAEGLALIPTGGQYEILCREYICRDADGSHVIVYVNAETGQEENIFFLVEDENGTLVL